MGIIKDCTGLLVQWFKKGAYRDYIRISDYNSGEESVRTLGMLMLMMMMMMMMTFLMMTLPRLFVTMMLMLMTQVKAWTRIRNQTAARGLGDRDIASGLALTFKP